MTLGVLGSPSAYREILAHLSSVHFTSSILSRFIVIVDTSPAFGPFPLS